MFLVCPLQPRIRDPATIKFLKLYILPYRLNSSDRISMATRIGKDVFLVVSHAPVPEIAEQSSVNFCYLVHACAKNEK